jgi:Icc-related predicted phosphoesterase
MIIDCISDLHGYYPKLEGGDILIVAGDLTANDTSQQVSFFLEWIEKQPYDRLIFIEGNHDNSLMNWISTEQSERMMANDDFHKWEYLIDSGTEFDGLKIWGSPWTKTFPEMNPHCKAFTCDTEEELADKFSLIPENIDILVTHSPPFEIRDRTARKERVGSISLQMELFQRLMPKLMVFGHVHEGYGKEYPSSNDNCIYVNASHVNEHYKPVNKPIRVIL